MSVKTIKSFCGIGKIQIFALEKNPGGPKLMMGIGAIAGGTASTISRSNLYPIFGGLRVEN
jgi:hypothetical protein